MRERGRGRREEGGGGGRGEEGEREGGRFFTSRSPTRATRGLTGGHLAGARTSSAFPTPRHAKRSSTDVGDVAFRAFESRCNREPLSRRNEAEIAPQHPARRDDCRHTSQRRYHQKDGSLSPSLTSEGDWKMEGKEEDQKIYRSASSFAILRAESRRKREILGNMRPDGSRARDRRGAFFSSLFLSPC